MIVSLIVATGKNGEIGKDNRLLWHLPADMKFFRETTSGHCVITGRKNYESIPDQFRPLPNRTNIVLTRNAGADFPGAFVMHSLEEALNFCKMKGENEAFVIGGAEVYKQALQKGLVDKIYLTKVEGSFDADAFFLLDESEWNEESKSLRQKDEKNPYSVEFLVLTRK